MDSRVDEHRPLFCDTGRHAGQWKVDFTGTIYLSDEEFARYSADGLRITLGVPSQQPQCEGCHRTASAFWVREVEGTEKRLCGKCMLAHDAGSTSDQHT